MIRSLSAIALIALAADPTSAADDKPQKNLKVEKQTPDDMVSRPSGRCVDDPLYKSKAGLLCAQHSSLDCNGFEHLGFSPQEIDELLRKCPVSCRVEPCVSIEDVVIVDKKERSVAPTLQAMQQRDQRNGQTHYVRRRTSEEACFEGWHSSCQDNPLYVSPVQTGCSIARTIFEGGKCVQAIAIGMTLKEVNELLLNCPCSCEVECGAVEPVTSEMHSGSDSEDGGAPMISPAVIAESNEMMEENLAEDENGEGFSIQTILEEYGVFIYAGVGAVIVFIAVIYVVRSYQRNNIENRDRSYSFDDYGSRTEVSGQSRSRVSFWGYN